ncbi:MULTISPECIES: isopentenyl-diphosphate Delta-isomerase [unclassified Curtobacterium]|uniref:isopentenyl-diphosphate Delta-isomerase n=1 Tax=unclassified Curtobacterium TaxID=257496 RepID=UPI000DA968AE|nr:MULTISPECIES: isopentenyl-diphosphate Delta-isomerase [unclassified Curtobacterium]PZE27985.1 isopentenyl-diphosphate delta-isomerase [Curtobacterium sp. MCBD17_028]PZE78253.1 isopentenyl-diphosphate delta-isomerase [Curtobacterium sp. MCBD17_019]PZF62417.1 isopentenyl-diphosphate delta-isomerase [Curtobacterium sp. MCBD17_034]PZM39877.1 isopentenyl-diphosphate delta-isomerase [Curtobacterium sp. MCBD17_031]WIB64055.1 isopentenyl-diphosphate Delta-isomerase [Curtobacterium sp. MCBD17_040]
MSTFPETVVLLDDDGAPIGVADKFAVHTDATPLHLAFSCHVSDPEGNILVTRRALTKATWPGVWTNTFCGHPGPDESFEDAIARRAARELGITVADVTPVLPDFRYRAVDASGIVENEVCPVFRATTTDVPRPAADEVAEWIWVSEDELRAAVAAAPFAFSPWLGWQLAVLPARALD